MNKKIKTILFTLFVAGLLTVSCSSKDKTGPSDNNGGGNNNGGGTISEIPTGIQDGEGVDKSYQYKYAASTKYGGLILTVDGTEAGTLTTQDQLQISTSQDKDPNLQGEYAGGILIKMPQLKDLGFTSDVIRVLPKNITHTTYGYDIHSVYVINDTNPEERLVYVELQTTGIQFNANFITMNNDITLTRTTIVKEQDKEEPVTTKVVYALKNNNIETVEKANSVTPIPVEGDVIDPYNK